MFHQGARVKQDLPPPRKPLPSREVLNSIEFNAKHEAYRFALANKKRSWAKRWLRSNGKSF